MPEETGTTAAVADASTTTTAAVADAPTTSAPVADASTITTAAPAYTADSVEGQLADLKTRVASLEAENAEATVHAGDNSTLGTTVAKLWVAIFGSAE